MSGGTSGDPGGAGGEPGPRDGAAAEDDGGMYGVFGEGRPRHIVGDSDEPPRRRPRKRPAAPPEDRPAP
jgi:hypothetical protein